MIKGLKTEIVLAAQLCRAKQFHNLGAATERLRLSGIKVLLYEAPVRPKKTTLKSVPVHDGEVAQTNRKELGYLS